MFQRIVLPNAPTIHLPGLEPLPREVRRHCHSHLATILNPRDRLKGLIKNWVASCTLSVLRMREAGHVFFYGQNVCRTLSNAQLRNFQCVLGFQPLLFPWNAASKNSTAVDEWFRWSKDVWEQAHQCLKWVVANNKCLQTDTGMKPHSFSQVIECGCPHGISETPQALESPPIDTLAYSKFSDPATNKLDLTHHCRIANSFHVSQLRAVTPGPLDAKSPPTMPMGLLDIDGHPAYSVKCLLQSRIHQGRLQYLVDWEGYGRGTQLSERTSQHGSARLKHIWTRPISCQVMNLVNVLSENEPSHSARRSPKTCTQPQPKTEPLKK